MSITIILQMGIGLAVVYYIAGLIVSFFTQQISIAFQKRGADLYIILKEALGDKFDDVLGDEVVKALGTVKTSPLTNFVNWVKKIFKRKVNIYIESFPKSSLAIAVLKQTTLNANANTNIPAIDSIIEAGFGKIKGQVDKGDQKWIDIKDSLQKDVESWLDSVMVSASQLYKENIRKVVIWISLIVTVALNIDTIDIGRYFWNEPLARQAASAQVDSILENAKDENGNIIIPDDYQSQISALSDLKIPLMWEGSVREQWSTWSKDGKIPLKLVGWLISWMAICQGSSFWYDALRKFKNAESQTQTSQA